MTVSEDDRQMEGEDSQNVGRKPDNKPPPFHRVVLVAVPLGMVFLVIFGAIPLLLLLAGHFWPEWAVADHHWLSAAGTIGDTFGLANAAFSGMAMVIAFFAIFSQMQELRLQREELQLTRQELKESQQSMRSMADDAKDDAVFAMHQEFSQKQRQQKAAWGVLARFMKCPKYREFVVKRSDPANFHKYPFTRELWEGIQNEFYPPPGYETLASAREMENEERRELFSKRWV